MKSISRTALAFFLLFLWSHSADASIILNCPEDSAALTPAPLEEEWAIEWWMPRHEEKLTEDGRETADVLFIGDSITHGWETTGNPVAEEYFQSSRFITLDTAATERKMCYGDLITAKLTASTRNWRF